VLDVLANDNVIPAGGASLTITRIVSQPNHDSVVLAENQLTYVQDFAGPYPYTTTFQYEISGGGSARAIATATVRVADRRLTLPIRPDTFSVQEGSANNPFDVLSNDSILPGSQIPLRIGQIVQAPAHGTAVINDAQTLVVYTPT